MPFQLVVAGHEGHGRTALLDALRVPVSAIDLDGHDEPVRAMLAAGPLGIDGYLLVVAADAGVTAEAREHAALLRALGVEPGLVAVTRADLADPADVLRKTRELIPGARALAVSVRTGDGLVELRAALEELVAAPPVGVALPAARLAGDGAAVETRVIDAALDFGPRREREPEHGVAVTVHLRGARAAARLARLGGRFWQVRLDRPLPALTGDRFVVRRPDSPGASGDGAPAGLGYTLGGGVVLDPLARRHPTSNEVIVRLTRISRGLPPLPPDPPRAR
jgi:hypothetical protein